MIILKLIRLVIEIIMVLITEIIRMVKAIDIYIYIYMALHEL